jgi:hypothetical protein
MEDDSRKLSLYQQRTAALEDEVMSHCCCTVATLLPQCCDAVVTLLSHYFHTGITLLLHTIALLLHSYYTGISI